MKKLILLLLFGNIFFTTFGQSFKVICSDTVGRNQVFNMKIVSDTDTSLYRLDIKDFKSPYDYVSINSLESGKEYNIILPNKLLETPQFTMRITNIMTKDSNSSFREEFIKVITTPAHPKISIYPNPATTKIHIDGAKKFDTLEIVDLLDRIVLKQICNDPDEFTVDITSLSEGIYFVRHVGIENSWTSVQKLVVR